MTDSPLYRFEPHSMFGKSIDGQKFPFGYISGGQPCIPVFELSPILKINPDTLTKLAQQFAAGPDMFALLKEIQSLPGPAVEIERAGLGDQLRAAIGIMEGQNND